MSDYANMPYSLDVRTYMILNGAQWGVAGFRLASDPNVNALLFDPSQPVVGQRIFTLNPTTIARMYHSEATLLPDGCVLVSGSDSQTPGYLKKLRLEVYTPSYLNQGFRQPLFTITETDWAYLGNYSIAVILFEGGTTGMRVSLVAGMFVSIRAQGLFCSGIY